MRNEKDIVILPGDKTTRPKYLFKIVIIGKAGVGKSSIISHATHDVCDTALQPNYVFDFSWKNYIIDDILCRIQIWDTCGQELYHSVIQNFYKRAYLAYLVFALDDYNSFLKAKVWLKEIKESENSDIIIFLIGNKCETQQRKVSMEQIEQFKTENEVEYYIETSAQNGSNIEKLFEDTIRKLYYNLVILSSGDDYDFDCSSRNIVIDKDNNTTESMNENSCRVCLC